jgi:methionine-rich copper-binding protein CopC
VTTRVRQPASAAGWRVALAALVLLVAGGAARAHSELRSTVPTDGARLAQPPAKVELVFNEDVQVTALRLLDASGGAVRLERTAPRGARRSESAALPLLAPGAYRIRWAAISADGHPISGTLRFEVLREAKNERELPAAGASTARGQR